MIKVLTLLFLLLTQTAFAAFESSTGDARYFGRGQSMIAGVYENAAVTVNPAAINTIENYYFLCNFMPGLQGLDNGEINKIHACFVYPQSDAHGFGNFGIGYNRLSSSFYFEQLFQFTYANYYNDLIFGTALNYYQVGFEKQITSQNDPLFKNNDYQKQAFGFNLGFLYILNSSVSLGLTGKNIYSSCLAEIDKEQAQPEYTTGFFYILEQGRDQMNVSLDLAYKSRSAYAAVGLEKWFFSRLIAARGGINTENFGFGTGIQYKYFTFNYSLQLWLKILGIYQQNLSLEVRF